MEKNFNIKTKKKFYLITKIKQNNKNKKKIIEINLHSIPKHYIKNLEKMKNIKIIKIGHMINQPINFLNISKNVKKIIFGKMFESDLILPDSIENITFCYNSKFNQSVNNLPNKLKYLKFGEKFNQPVDNLPSGLKYLFLGQFFNQELNFLPESIITLEFSYNSFYPKSLENLPNNIKKLLLGSKYQNNLLNNINLINLNNLPNNIKFLRIPILNNIQKFPTQINKLILYYDFDIDNLLGIKNFENITELEIYDSCEIYSDDKIIDMLYNNNLQHIKKIIINKYFYGFPDKFKLKLNIIEHIYKIIICLSNDKTTFILENKLS